MPSLNHSLPTTIGQHNTFHQATDRVKSLSNRESQKTLQSYHLSDISLHQFQYFVHLHYPLFRQFLSLVQIFNPTLVPLLTSAPACKLLISFSPLVSKLYQNIALPTRGLTSSQGISIPSSSHLSMLSQKLREGGLPTRGKTVVPPVQLTCK